MSQDHTIEGSRPHNNIQAAELQLPQQQLKIPSNTLLQRLKEQLALQYNSMYNIAITSQQLAIEVQSLQYELQQKQNVSRISIDDRELAYLRQQEQYAKELEGKVKSLSDETQQLKMMLKTVNDQCAKQDGELTFTTIQLQIMIDRNKHLQEQLSGGDTVQLVQHPGHIQNMTLLHWSQEHNVLHSSENTKKVKKPIQIEHSKQRTDKQQVADNETAKHRINVKRKTEDSEASDVYCAKRLNKPNHNKAIEIHSNKKVPYTDITDLNTSITNVAEDHTTAQYTDSKAVKNRSNNTHNNITHNNAISNILCEVSYNASTNDNNLLPLTTEILGEGRVDFRYDSTLLDEQQGETYLW